MARTPGSKVLSSIEQSDKGKAEGAFCLVANIIRMACVIIVMESNANAEGVSRKVKDVVDAAEPLLGSGDTLLLTGERRDWEKLELSLCRRAFEKGQLTLVVTANWEALQRLNDFLQTVQPQRLMVVVDEADNLWTYHVTPQRRHLSSMTQREE